MKHGTKLTNYPDHRNYSYHRTFGSITPISYPTEYDADAGLTMPDQNAEGQPYGCTNYTSDELCTDLDLTIYDHNQLEIVTHANRNGGGWPQTALKAVKTLRNKGDYFQLEMSEADWFDTIRAVILHNARTSVSVGSRWYPVFESATSSGIAPSPVYWKDVKNLGGHNYKISGWKSINGVPMLKAKTWQGKNFGDKGWLYFSREQINNLFANSDTCAFTIAVVDPAQIKMIEIDLLSKIISVIRNLITKMYGSIIKKVN